MANIVENHVYIDAIDEKLNEILEFVKGPETYENGYVEEVPFDFNKIIPMPEEYNEGSKWYYWRIENWGTKWNASGGYSDGAGYFMFDTAWSTPVPIIKRLSELFKDIEFSVRYADEDFGYNVGEYTYMNGRLVESNIPEDGSEEAYELAADILGYDAREDWKEMYGDDNLC